ncbi:MAG: type II toxin-antitoxin system RelE/ParE family toxin [Proteobacteria bacterium]|nr:type II toxin-antitoxin system RelE/ParE family toxin [Pseudomonadota bacterium]
MRIVWTASAVRDLAATRAYIASDNAPAADRQIARVLAAVGSLLRFPELGRTGRRLATRELVVGRTAYVVAYRVRGASIEILRVLHGRQRWPDHL